MRLRFFPKLFLALLLFLENAHVEPASETKLAVVGPEAGSPFSGLLTAKLAALPGLVVLERSELGKLATEKQIQDFAAGNELSQALRLLQADGLLVLEKKSATDGLVLRLFSTHNGVRLWDEEVPINQASEEVTAKLALVIATKSAKCKLPPDQTLLVSVLSMRSTLFSPEEVEIGARLARLVETRLNAEPDVILLERRQLEDARFERSLGTAISASLVASALLVEGSLEHEVRGHGLKLSLKVRTKKGSRETQLDAPDGDLPRLANEAVAFITQSKVKMEDLGEMEAKEYLAEAIWAESHGLYKMALEYAETAMALGETSPRLREKLIRIYIQLAYSSSYENSRLVPTALPLETRYEMISRGLFLCRDLVREKHPSPQGQIVDCASSLLFELRELPESKLNPETIRGLVRELAPFDPTLKQRPKNKYSAQYYTSVWAESADEIIAFCDTYARSKYPERFEIVDGLLGRNYLAHFLDQAGVNQRLQVLAYQWIKNPPTELFGLLLLQRGGSPEEAAWATDKYLERLLELIPDLEKEKELNFYLYHLQFMRRVDPASIDGSRQGDEWVNYACRLFSVLKTKQKDFISFCLFKNSAFRDYTPAQEQKLWKAIQAHYLRWIESLPESKQEIDRRELRGLLRGFADKYPDAFPASELEVPRTPAPYALKITRFWCPALNGASFDFIYNFGSISLANDEVWISGRWRRKVNGVKDASDVLVRISLPDLKHSRYPSNGAGLAGNVSITPDSVYLVNRGKFLSRFDRITETWEQREIFKVNDVSYCKGKVYLHVVHWFNNSPGDYALVEYDWNNQQSTLLFSTKRNPPLNQIDRSKASRINGLFEGPEQQLWLVTGLRPMKAYLVQTKPGDWAKAIEMPIDGLVQNGHGALLVGSQCLFVSPKAIEIWLDSSGPGKWGWKMPEWRNLKIGEHGMDFRPGELFILHRDIDGFYHLRYYWEQGPAEGLNIPLEFHFPNDLKKNIEGLIQQETLDRWDDPYSPEKTHWDLRFYASSKGVLLFHNAGFWFIPNEDLDRIKSLWLSDQTNPDISSQKQPPPGH